MYRHAQFGRPILAGTILGAVLATLLVAWLSPRTLAAAPGLVAALYATLAVAYVLFYRLVVTVDERCVRAAFGIGWIAKRVPVSDIVATEIVRTRLRWGWGIHWTPAGWLYNVGGRHAVRLVLASERPLLIGSDEPQALQAAIDTARARAG